jgi:hypothetical protein
MDAGYKWWRVSASVMTFRSFNMKKSEKMCGLWILQRVGPVAVGTTRAMLLAGCDRDQVRRFASLRGSRDAGSPSPWLDWKKARLLRIGQTDRFSGNRVLMLLTEGNGFVRPQRRMIREQATRLELPSLGQSPREIDGAGVQAEEGVEE